MSMLASIGSWPHTNIFSYLVSCTDISTNEYSCNRCHMRHARARESVLHIILHLSLSLRGRGRRSTHHTEYANVCETHGVVDGQPQPHGH